ncbi:hypothetical protein [Kitasatospora purpeofusca]|uniref:hypothetical protein n=1 Tax=Kitasatospora purpeofusca TaxID=67352 RepID=UPI002A5AF790|nr:hypothetical protein [Kitasatospora purpeofusca]MDY0812650.1 hypothetical protein [Kitasatospora purpeofusca]
MRVLTAMRILVAGQGAGTYVSGLEPHLLLEAMSFAADVSHGQSARQLLHIRRMLEPQAIALAADLLSESEPAELEAILEAGSWRPVRRPRASSASSRWTSSSTG